MYDLWSERAQHLPLLLKCESTGVKKHIYGLCFTFETQGDSSKRVTSTCCNQVKKWQIKVNCLNVRFFPEVLLVLDMRDVALSAAWWPLGSSACQTSSHQAPRRPNPGFDCRPAGSRCHPDSPPPSAVLHRSRDAHEFHWRNTKSRVSTPQGHKTKNRVHTLSKWRAHLEENAVLKKRPVTLDQQFKTHVIGELLYE